MATGFGIRRGPRRHRGAWRLTAWTAALVLLTGAWLPSVVSAQGIPAAGAASRADLWAAGVWSPPATGGSVTSTYAPTLVAMEGSAAANQTLTLDAGHAWGVEAGVRLFVSRHAGIEVAVSRTWAELGGVNTPYTVAIDYLSRQPPDYILRPVHVERTTEWADTEGTRRVTTIVAGPVLRWVGRSGRASGTVSGGLGLHRVTGPIRSLAYTAFRLGGHSTLFPSQHRIEVEPEAGRWIVGPYLGADVRVPAAGAVGFVAGARVYLGGTPEPMGITVERLVDPDDDVFVPDLATVAAALEPGAAVVHVRPRWHLFAGLTIGIM